MTKKILHTDLHLPTVEQHLETPHQRFYISLHRHINIWYMATANISKDTIEKEPYEISESSLGRGSAGILFLKKSYY